MKIVENGTHDVVTFDDQSEVIFWWVGWDQQGNRQGIGPISDGDNLDWIEETLGDAINRVLVEGGRARRPEI